jgi:hypothetical protein
MTDSSEGPSAGTPQTAGRSRRQTGRGRREASPPFYPSEQQALATFYHAAEEIRFFKGQQWKVTNYALIAYGALAATPPWIADCKEVNGWSWFCVMVNLASAFAVLITAYFAYRVLGSLDQSHDKELRRMKAARRELPLVKRIHSRFRLTRKGAWWRPRRARTRPGRVIWVLHTALFIGAELAVVINLLRVPWPRVWASVTAGAV